MIFDDDDEDDLSVWHSTMLFAAPWFTPRNTWRTHGGDLELHIVLADERWPENRHGRPVSAEVARSDWREGRASGGLWDHEAEAQHAAALGRRVAGPRRRSTEAAIAMRLMKAPPPAKAPPKPANRAERRKQRAA